MTTNADVTPSPDLRDDLNPSEFSAYVGVTRSKRAYLPIKRTMDIALSLALILIISPVLLATAILIKLESSGPIIYRTRRHGLNGAPFNMLKFRSMAVAGRDDDLLFRHRVREQGFLPKSVDDPRLTRVGRHIRRLSIDELPQLFNVLRGDMSLVGPRPVLPEMLLSYPIFDMARTLVRPGVGGLWQIRERANSTHIKFMWKHDLEYLCRMSVWFDLQILTQSAMAALKRTGAK